MILFCCVIITHAANAQYIRWIYNNELIKGQVSAVIDKSLYKRGEFAIDTNIRIINYTPQGEATTQQIRKHYDTRFPFTPATTFLPQEWDAKFDYSNNAKGNNLLVKVEIPIGMHFFIYDKHKLMYEDITYDKNSEEIVRSMRKYDNKGNLIIIKVYDTKSKYIMRQDYRYDDNNFLMEETVSKVGAPSFKYRYEYVTFDTHGNWTKRLRFLDDEKEPNIDLREIKYAE